MEIENLKISKDDCKEKYVKIFLERSGLNKPGIKYETMVRTATELYKKIEKDIQFKASYLKCSRDEFQLDGKLLEVCGETFICNGFEQLNIDDLDELIIYGCSIGQLSLKTEDVMEQLYLELWGTSIIDTLRCVVMEHLGGGETLSDSFGPGFYGMSVEEINKIDRLLDLSRIGIRITDSYAMLPSKSCVGLIFKVNGSYKEMNKQCHFCHGSAVSCRLCSYNK